MRLFCLCALYCLLLWASVSIQAHADDLPAPTTEPGAEPTAEPAAAPILMVDAASLPWSIRLINTLELTPAQLEAFSTKMGATLDHLSNQTFEMYGGVNLKINAMQFATEADAQRMVESGPFKGSPNVIVRNGRALYEIISPALGAALFARSLVGATPTKPFQYAVEADVAPIRSAEPEDYGIATKLLNAYISAPAGISDEDLTKSLEPLTSKMNQGPWLRTYRPSKRQKTLLLSSMGSSDSTPDGFDLWTFDVSTLSRRGGIFYIAFVIVGNVHASPAPHLAPNPRLPYDLASDPVYFPLEDPAIKSIVADALKDLPADATNAQKLAALHRWTVEHIPYGGPVPGSRLPTLDVLAAKQGRCFEAADVLVTLCRAAGIPAYPVVGWVAGMGGHVWVEAQVAPSSNHGESYWQAIDATVPWVGLDERYISLWHYDVPPVYLSLPKVTVKERSTKP